MQQTDPPCWINVNLALHTQLCSKPNTGSLHTTPSSSSSSYSSYSSSFSSSSSSPSSSSSAEAAVHFKMLQGTERDPRQGPSLSTSNDFCSISTLDSHFKCFTSQPVLICRFRKGAGNRGWLAPKVTGGVT